MKNLISLFFFLALLWMGTGCTNEAELDANGVPHTLILALPGGQVAGLTQENMEPMRQYLEKELSIPVKFIFVQGAYSPIIEALRAKKVHMAYVQPFAYVLAAPKVPMTPIVILGENGKPSMYNSCIFTSSSSKIKTMADLKANAKNLTICYPDPASTSGHLIPGGYLKSIGLSPDSSFKQVVYSGSHPATIMSVYAGKEDIGCSMTEMGINRLIERGQIKKEGIRILWVSPPIISDPIVLRSDINKDFIKKVQNAYLNVKTKAPKVFDSYIKILRKDPKIYSYIVAQDSFYDNLRSIAKYMHYLDPKK